MGTWEYMKLLSDKVAIEIDVTNPDDKICCYLMTGYESYTASVLEYINGSYSTKWIDLNQMGATDAMIDDYLLRHNVNGKIYDTE